VDLVVNDLAPDIIHQLRADPALQVVEGPGTDYAYVGINLRDPVLRDVRVRQALAYAVDREAIVTHPRRRGA
jgi:peptide/nickel transport system substrate-binding protein